MPGTENVSLLVAFTAGLISFFSPCVLPLIPSYMAFITGISLEELSAQENLKEVRRTVVWNSLLFIGGFSSIFIAMGASATFIGAFLQEHIRWFEIIGGIVVIILGLHFLGLFKLKFLERERKFHLKSKPLGLFGTFVVGMAFGAGWTPCVGPILGSILTLAATTQDVATGIVLLVFYSLGLGIPFFLAGILIHKFFEYFKAIRKYFRIITAVGGLLLIIVGVLLITGYFTAMFSYLSY
jgi:cytochrome c-type biogenesis protein